jgi:hypothetical protein
VTQADSGGNLKYAIIGLLLLGGGAAAYFLTQPEPPPPAPAAQPPKRETALAPQEIELAEPEPDAAVDSGKPMPRIVYKYVGGDWSCDGGEIDSAKARAVIAENNRQVRACYERALKNNNKLQGKAALQIKVDRFGNVAGTRTAGSLQDEKVFACIRQVAGSWKFPAPTKGSCVVLSSKFDFSPQN